MSNKSASSVVLGLTSTGRRTPSSRLRLRPDCEGLEDRTVLSPSLIEAPIAAFLGGHHPHRLAHHPLAHPVHHAARAHHAAYVGRLPATVAVPQAQALVHPAAAAPTIHHLVVPSHQVLDVHAQPAPKTPLVVTQPSTPPTTSAPTSGTTLADPTLVTLDLKPLDVNLLGLEVKTSEITVTVSAQPGSGELLGNLLTDVSNLLNLQGVNNALNNVLGSVVTLANSASLSVAGANTSGTLGNAQVATTPVLTAHIAPVNLNLLGAVVQTSPIDLSIVAHSGPGLVLGNVVSDLANLLNTPPKNGKLDLQYITTQLQNLLNELDAQLPGIPSAATTAATTTATTTTGTGTTQVLSLTVPSINLNLLGLVLQTDPIQVNADAQSGSGDLLGNLLSDLLNTLKATPADVSALNSSLNALLAKVVGVLNASSLTLPTNALATLSPALQTLALPNLVNGSGTASTPVLNLDIASTTSTTPPVDVDLLGLLVTTSNIHAQLSAQTGNGQILGNLVYNVSHLLDPGGSLNLLTILGDLGV